MTAFEQVKIVKDRLKENGIDDKDEAEWLVALALGTKISKLHEEVSLTEKQIRFISKCLSERVSGKPMSYIFKSASFFGREFYVDSNVLIPRPETELLVEKVIEEIKANEYHSVLDIGCGSGVIGTTICAETGVTATMLDVSRLAIKIAKKNAKKYVKNVKFLQSDIFNGVKVGQKFDVIVSNPPYITSEDMTILNRSVRDFEPHIALWGGVDGLFYYRKIIEQADKFLSDGGMIAFEIGYNQAKSVKNILEQNNYKNVQIYKDYDKIDRIITAKMEKKQC